MVFGIGWLLLGPTKLFELSRDVGRVVGDLRRSADKASASFTDAMEAEAREAEEKVAEAADKLEDAEAAAGKAKAADDGAVEDDREFMSGPDVGGVLRDVSDTMVAGPAAAVAAEQDAAALGVEDRTVGRLPDLEAPAPTAEDAEVTRGRFLDQLNRANDPEQTAEGEEDASEEDVEVARLEYELAKARLAAKRRQVEATGEKNVEAKAKVEKE